MGTLRPRVAWWLVLTAAEPRSCLSTPHCRLHLLALSLPPASLNTLISPMPSTDIYQRPASRRAQCDPSTVQALSHHSSFSIKLTSGSVPCRSLELWECGDRRDLFQLGEPRGVLEQGVGLQQAEAPGIGNTVTRHITTTDCICDSAPVRLHCCVFPVPFLCLDMLDTQLLGIVLQLPVVFSPGPRCPGL